MEQTPVLKRKVTFSGSENEEHLIIENGYTRDLDDKELDSSDIMDEKDQEKITVCSVIPYETNEMSETDHAVFSDNTMKSYTCEIDGQEYTILIDLDPYSMFMNDEKIEPKISEGDVTSAEDLSFHRNASDIDPDDEVNFNLYSCNECNGECPCTKRRRRHPFVHRWELAYGCEFCGKQFKSCSFLASHMKKHNKKLRKCKFCDKLFGCKSSLKMHLPVHIGDEVVNSDKKNERMNIFDAYADVLNLAKETDAISSETEVEQPNEHSKNKDRRCKTRKSLRESEHDTTEDDEDSGKADDPDKSVRTTRREKFRQSRKKSRQSRKKDKKIQMQEKARKHNNHSKAKNTSSVTFNGATRLNKRRSAENTVLDATENIMDKKRSIDNAIDDLVEKLASEKGILRSLRRSESIRINKSSKQHGRKRYTCEICFNKYNSKNSLKRHYLVHNIDRPFACDKCDKRFTMKSYLTAHRKLHIAGGAIFSCEICVKEFNRECNLKAHMLTHSDFKPFSCRLCGRKFNHASNLKRHEILHTGLKLHVCMLCGKQFSLASGLKEHVIVHDWAPEMYRCDLCNKQFKAFAKLRRHTQVHVEEPRYICLVCNKSFHQKTGLQRHMKLHSEAETLPKSNKRFMCFVCNRSYHLKSSLQRHMKMHSEANLLDEIQSLPKRFRCLVCNKSYYQMSGLRRHMKKHSGADHLYEVRNLPKSNRDFIKAEVFDDEDGPSENGYVDEVDDNYFTKDEAFHVDHVDPAEELNIKKIVDSVFVVDPSGESQTDTMVDNAFIKTEVFDDEHSEHYRDNIDKVVAVDKVNDFTKLKDFHADPSEEANIVNKVESLHNG